MTSRTLCISLGWITIVPGLALAGTAPVCLPPRQLSQADALCKDLKVITEKQASGDSDSRIQELIKEEKAKPVQVFTKPTSRNCSQVSYKIPEMSLKPGESVYLAMPKEMQDRAVKFVTLGHRQDPSKPMGMRGDKEWDETPGLTSVQLHSKELPSSSAWRYWAGHSSGAKGAKFAEHRYDPEIEGLYEWGTIGHKAVGDDSFSTAPLKADGIRIVSVGKDPILLSELDVKTAPEKPDHFDEGIFSPGTRFGNIETQAGQAYGGGQQFGGKFPGAVALSEEGDESEEGASKSTPKLPKGWKVQKGALHIPLNEGDSLSSIEVACGDTHPDGESNKDGGTGSLGGAKLSVGVKGKDGKIDWIMNRDNVPPNGFLMTSPRECGRKIQAGEELIIKSEDDTAYVMGVRVGSKKLK